MTQRSMTLNHKPQPLETEDPGRPRRAEFEAFFEQHWARLCAALFRFTGDTAEAEDLALEAFVRLWQRPPASEKNLGGWLYRVATRLGLNRLRAAARRDRYELDAYRSGEAARGPEDGAARGQDDKVVRGLDDELERRLARGRVRAALARMDDRQARLLLLRHSGFSYQEIAAALDLNPASIGTLLNRAEAAFEKMYSEPAEPNRLQGGSHASRRT